MHLYNKENIQIKSSSFLHTSSHPDKKQNSANRIISPRRGEERLQYTYSTSNFNQFCILMQGLQLEFYSVLSVLTKRNYSTYRINSSTRNLQEILQLQGSSHAGRYKASSSYCSLCIQAFYTVETLLVTL